MTRFRYLCAGIVGALLTALPASAATIPFSGTLSRNNPPAAPNGRCADPSTPANEATVINNNEGGNTSTGTSNLGNFLSVGSACIILPPSTTYDGEFTFTFESGATLFGTTTSKLTPVSPGLLSIFGEFLITGGTGAFAGAGGSFTETGTLSFAAGRAIAVGDFTGTLTTVPEPAAFALFGLGVAVLAGAAGRRAAKAG